MEAVIIYMTGVTITISMAFTAAMYFDEPLRKLLEEVCGNGERADLWTELSKVTIVLVPLLLSMLVTPDPNGTMRILPVPTEEWASFFYVVAQVRCGIFGLMGTLVTLGGIIMFNLPAVSTSPNVAFEVDEKGPPEPRS